MAKEKSGGKAAKPARKVEKTPKSKSKSQGKAAGKLKTAAKAGPVRVATVTTFGRGGNRGGGAMEVAPPAAVPPPVDLGQIEIPQGADAERVLRELAILNDRVLVAHKTFKDAQDVAKQKKAKWDELSEELQKKLKKWTHKSDLPLFDGPGAFNAAEREADQQTMQAGPVAVPAAVVDQTDAPTETPTPQCPNCGRLKSKAEHALCDSCMAKALAIPAEEPGEALEGAPDADVPMEAEPEIVESEGVSGASVAGLSVPDDQIPF